MTLKRRSGTSSVCVVLVFKIVAFLVSCELLSFLTASLDQSFVVVCVALVFYKIPGLGGASAVFR